MFSMKEYEIYMTVDGGYNLVFMKHNQIFVESFETYEKSISFLYGIL